MLQKMKQVAKKSKTLSTLYRKIKKREKLEDVIGIVSNRYPTPTGKKIILIGHSGGQGGAEILLKNMIGEFLKQQQEVTVLVRGFGPMIEEYQKLAPTFVIDSQEKTAYALTALKQLGYHSAILNTTVNGDLIPLLKEKNIKTIQLIHELPGVIHQLGLEERAQIIGEQADLVIFPARYVYEQFQTIAPVKTKYQILPQGLYMVYDKWNRTKATQVLNEKWQIPKTDFLVLNVGLGEKRKGLDLFVQVASAFQDEKEISFVWLGAVNEAFKKELEPQIKPLSNLYFPGYISEKEVTMLFFDRCDLFLLTSREDPFPSVVLEAFNASKPVIGFENAGGFQEIVQNEKSGYLVPFEDTKAMVDKIRMLKENREMLKKLGKGAKKICEKHRFSQYVTTLIQTCK